MTRMSWWMMLGLVAAVAGCEHIIPADEEVFTYDADNDGAVDDMDCDPTDPEIGSAVRYAPDLDGDGWGTYAGSYVTCDPNDPGIPVGAVTQVQDCDDDNADVSPGIAEVLCDGLDNDCDEGTPDDDGSCDTGA